MSGRLVVVGLGPGAEDLMTPRALAAIAAASDLVGYKTYLDRVPPRVGQTRHASDNRAELQRAREALTLAAAGRHVAIVSSGDAGVFAMASAVFEAIDRGEPQWRGLEIDVVPGVSAVLAAAARIGAPLGHDFCVLSLSDNLKSWEVIAARLTAAAASGMVLALYNPRSSARPDQLAAAFGLLRPILPPTTPVVFATAISRPDERVRIATLADAAAIEADMSTLVLIGTAATRRIEREGAAPWLYAPRSAA